jgi:hypothetical protein
MQNLVLLFAFVLYFIPISEGSAQQDYRQHSIIVPDYSPPDYRQNVNVQSNNVNIIVAQPVHSNVQLIEQISRPYPDSKTSIHNYTIINTDQRNVNVSNISETRMKFGNQSISTFYNYNMEQRRSPNTQSSYTPHQDRL